MNVIIIAEQQQKLELEVTVGVFDDRVLLPQCTLALYFHSAHCCSLLMLLDKTHNTINLSRKGASFLIHNFSVRYSILRGKKIWTLEYVFFTTHTHTYFKLCFSPVRKFLCDWWQTGCFSTMHNVSFQQGGDNSDEETVGIAEQEACWGGQEIGSASRNKRCWKAGGKFLFCCLKVLPQAIPLLSLKDTETLASPKSERSDRRNISLLILHWFTLVK